MELRDGVGLWGSVRLFCGYRVGEVREGGREG